MVEYGHLSYKPLPLDPFDNVVNPFSHTVWAFTAAAAGAAGAAMAAAHSVYAKGGTFPHKIRREAHRCNTVKSFI